MSYYSTVQALLASPTPPALAWLPEGPASCAEQLAWARAQVLLFRRYLDGASATDPRLDAGRGVP